MKIRIADSQSRRELVEKILSLPEGTYSVEIKDLRRTRSLRQNSLLHVVIDNAVLQLRPMLEEDLRPSMNRDYLKSYLKEKLLGTRKQKVGEVEFELAKATRGLSRPEMAEFTEKCLGYLIGEVGLEL